MESFASGEASFVVLVVKHHLGIFFLFLQNKSLVTLIHRDLAGTALKPRKWHFQTAGLGGKYLHARRRP